MADIVISELNEASTIRDDDLFVLRQIDEAKKLKGSILRAYAEEAGAEAGAQAGSEAGAAVAVHHPYINESNSHWMVWDGVTSQYVDSGVSASALTAGTGITISNNTINAHAIVNPNLLDNWYFGNPVNQRGFTSATDSGYCIDRWVISKTNASTVASVALAPGVIQLTNTDADADRYIEIIQYLEETVCSAISNRTATFSILTDRGLITFTDTLIPDSYRAHSAGNVTLYMRVNTGGTANVRLRLYSGTALSVYAAKLELGTQQTLAHQENGVWVLNEIPDYGEQLRKCQRYYITLKKTSSYNSSMLYGFNSAGTIIALQLPCSIREASAYTATISGTLYLKSASQSTVVFDGTETVSVTQNFPYIVLTASKTGTGGSGGAANSDGLRIVVSAEL